MKQYFKYFWYVAKHRWFVMLECFKVGLIWRGLVHDLDKLSFRKFFSYANFFYGTIKPVRDSGGYFKPTNTGNLEFEYAWLFHKNKNRHHIQFWLLPDDDGNNICLPIPDKYIKEIICDWIGAGIAQGYGNNTVEWYAKNKGKMSIERNTRCKIEKAVDNMSKGVKWNES